MIAVNNVSKYFNSVKAVDGVTFDVRETENFIFLGTSGCGKTTTLRMINRLTEPSAGEIFLNGKNILSQQPELLRRSIGYVLQHNGLFPHYTVAENIAIVPLLLRWDKEKIRKRTIELMEKLHLPPGKYLQAYPDQLSGGQQQRVGLARAMAADPPVLLMDEPFGALDAVTRHTISKELSELDEFKRKTIIMVTHDIQEAFALADRICLMDKGKVIQLGNPEELLFNPVNDFVTNFLKEHKTQLSFRSVKLQRLWAFLPDKEGLPDAGVTIHSATTVWEAMEIFYTQSYISNGVIDVVDASTEQKKQVNFLALMSAMNHLNK
ncbi:MAG: ABC transporter ATP-binding protein [Ferruginibacter sp.]|nr:ABC transporter ATP-binding protein [Chitinophagaceae bacterium]